MFPVSKFNKHGQGYGQSISNKKLLYSGDSYEEDIKIRN